MSEQQTISATRFPTDRFLRKADDEIYRAVRYQVPFAVVSCSLSALDADAAEAIEAFANDNLRQVDFVARLSPGRYVFGLPFTGPNTAAVVADDLRAALYRYSPVIGVAGAPFEGRRAGLLVSSAELNAREDLTSEARPLLRAG